MTNKMTWWPLLGVLVYACGVAVEDAPIGTEQSAYNSNPPSILKCPEGNILCGKTCVDPERDNHNCGWCGVECDWGVGEFCARYHCANVRDYGFSIGPKGPKPYRIERDLPRPIEGYAPNPTAP